MPVTRSNKGQSSTERVSSGPAAAPLESSEQRTTSSGPQSAPLVRAPHRTPPLSPSDAADAGVSVANTGAAATAGAAAAAVSASHPRAAESSGNIPRVDLPRGNIPRALSRAPSRAASLSTRSNASGKRRMLLKAQEELMQKEVKLARIRMATLEAELEEEEELSMLEETVRPVEEEQNTRRTSEWVSKSVLALAATPHQPEPEEPPRSGPFPDALQQGVRRSDARPQAFADDALTRPLPPPPSQQQGRADYSELAAAIAYAARTAVAPAIAPPPRHIELPVFNGASSDWLPFKAAFEESAASLSETENLARLRRCLRGPAKEAVQCLFIGATSTSTVMKMLQSRFGRPDALVAAELYKLRALPKLTENPRDICVFASRVVNVVATIEALRKPHYLYNAEVVRSVVDKLPPALRYRFYDFHAEQSEHQAELVTLSRFLSVTSEKCGNFAPVEIIASEDRREAPRRIRAYQTDAEQLSGQSTTPPNDPPASSSRASTASQKRNAGCPLCSGNHQPVDCHKMKEATVHERWEMAKKHRLCFRCMKARKGKHFCKVKNKCNINGCTYWHHKLLHQDREAAHATQDGDPSEEEPAEVVASAKVVAAAMLKILPVKVSGPQGEVNTYALLDDGSTCSLVDAATVEQIGATGPVEPLRIEGVAGARVNALQSRRVKITIQGRSGQPFIVTARTMNDLKLSSQSVRRDLISESDHLVDISDDLVYKVGRPTVLLGQDNWHLLRVKEMRTGARDQPVASLTELGWVLHGNVRQAGRIAHVHRVNYTADAEEQSMEAMMKEHFALESLGVEPRRSLNKEEQRAIDILKNTTRRLENGRYETGLLWKSETIAAPESYDMAMKRLLSVERKLDKNEDLKRRYNEQINLLFENGYAEVAPPSVSGKIWYLPHFAVFNPQKPQKLRIVHDAAAKASGMSLNDMLLSGPDLLQSLPGVLMRFRQRPVAVCGDIKDMFLRITVRNEDRDMQRFLWRGNRRSDPPTEYRMKSVIFGATSSPCTAIYVKNANAERYSTTLPEAAEAVVRNHYMDDYLASFDTEEKALKISAEVARIHEAGGFQLQKWTSNSTLVRQGLDSDSSPQIIELSPEKILGMVWNTEADTLGFNMNLTKVPEDVILGKRTPTKREALKTVMSVYDPLGLATPVTIQAKRILQDTWRSGTGWDQKLQQEEAAAWDDWVKTLEKMSRLAIPRCHLQLTVANSAELHTFVDASSSAYAAAVYWRVVGSDGQPRVSLAIAKGRVAPLKTISIPRLELQAAVLGCRLAVTAEEEHDVKPARRVFWSDSSTVLTWLRKGPRNYKPFVAHRVAEIAEATKTNEWRWVPTKLNVADDATRATPGDFDSQHRWYVGPDFLHHREEDWPQEDLPEQLETGEERVCVVTTATRLIDALPEAARFSNWMRLLRATARVLQFIALLRQRREKTAATRKKTGKNTEDDPEWRRTASAPAKRATTNKRPARELSRFIPLTAELVNDAELLWVRAVQQQHFPQERMALRKGSTIPRESRLHQLAVHLGADDIIRLKSRIDAAAGATSELREPAVLDGSHPWTRLFIAWTHAGLHHGGFETTTNEVRQRYWVLRLRDSVRSTLRACQRCRIRKAKPAWPSTGNHPPSRLAHHQRPFTYTGLDFFGPITVTVGRTRQKRYGALFTCLTTRAVYLDVAGSLSTDSAVMVLRRFICRRGCPTEIWSDNGTNLRGADNELKKAAQGAMAEEASVRFIRWRYIPPSAPFMGGAWERLVRSVKTALYATLNERAPKEEVLATLLLEAEHTVNSRPLTHVSTAPDDEEALTPNHFLMGGPSRVPLPGVFTEGDIASRRDWIVSQRLADHFWARWVREYLPELQHRREPQARGKIRVGDLVQIADGTLPRNAWPRGRVIAAYPGPDGETRAVDVQTTRGILRRPTKKLVILPVDRERPQDQLPVTAAGGNVRDN